MSDRSDRDRATANRVLGRRGELLSFRRYSLTKDKINGSQAKVLTHTVSALAAVLSVYESKDRDLRRGDQIILVQAEPFPGDLTDEWVVILGGVEWPISSPVAAGRTAPSDPASYFEGVLRVGASTIGATP